MATLLGAAVLLSGFRPPDGGLAIAADEVAGVELAQADAAKRKARKERMNKPRAKSTVRKRKNASFDLTYVPNTTRMLYGMRPAALAGVKGFQPLVGMFEPIIDSNKSGIELKQFDQFMVILFTSKPEEPFGRHSLLAVKTTKPVSFDKFIAWVGGGRPLVEKEVAGSKYSVNEHGRAFYTPDDRNLLWSSDDAIRSLIEQAKDGAGSPKWSKQFDSVSTNQLSFAVDMEAVQSPMVQSRFGGGPGPNPGLAAFSPLWEKTTVTVAGVQFGNESTATVSAWCRNAEDAKQVQRTLQSLIPLGQNMLSGQKSQLPKMPESMRGQISALTGFLEKLLDDVKVETTPTDNGALVTLQVEAAAATIPLMVGLTLPVIQSARASARRAQSSNNMKQLGLAMHNYHNIHKEFPAAVMTARRNTHGELLCYPILIRSRSTTRTTSPNRGTAKIIAKCSSGCRIRSDIRMKVLELRQVRTSF